MPENAETYFRSPRGIFMLMLGVFLPATMYVVNLFLSYVLVNWGCSSGAGTFPLHMTNLGSFILSVFGGYIGFRNWTLAGRGWPSEAGGPMGRSRWLGMASLLMAGLFTIGIVAVSIPPLFVNPCAA